MYRENRKNITKELKRKYSKKEVKKLIQTIEKILLNDNYEEFIIHYKGYINVTKEYNAIKDRYDIAIKLETV